MCFCPLLRLEASSLSVPFCINHYAGAGRFTVLVFSLSVCLSVCLLICLGYNANMTMCALDTRNDSMRDTNAVINVLLQFNSFLIVFVFITHSLLHHVFVSNPDGWGLPHYNTSDCAIGWMILIQYENS